MLKGACALPWSFVCTWPHSDCHLVSGFACERRILDAAGELSADEAAPMAPIELGSALLRNLGLSRVPPPAADSAMSSANGVELQPGSGAVAAEAAKQAAVEV
jgi:hypothetical protein